MLNIQQTITTYARNTTHNQQKKTQNHGASNLRISRKGLSTINMIKDYREQ